MSEQALIPVLILIDVEPDGFFVDPRQQPPWSGFERAMDIVRDIRRDLEQRTRRAAHFIWLVRADPQVAGTYGSPTWAFEFYRDRFAELAAAQDEIGVHVHAYRWETKSRRWIEDYGNQAWVDHCVRMSIDAFEEAFGRAPDSFSMGMDWTNQATMRVVSDLRVRYELSPIIGKEPQPFPRTGTYTGVAPDCSRIPRRPYQPSCDDFLAAEVSGNDDIWIFPQLSRVAGVERSWKRTLYDLVRRQPAPRPWTRKLFWTDDSAALRPEIHDALSRRQPGYLTFAVRTDEFTRRASIAHMRHNLESLFDHPAAGALIFTTPAEALAILEGGVEPLGGQ